MKFRAVLGLILAAAFIAPVHSFSQAPNGSHTAAYQSADKKLTAIDQNSKATPPSTAPVKFSAAELNAFVNEGGVVLPNGVEHVQFSSQPQTITAITRVDFDKITQGKHSMNPLLMLFTGVHDVTVVARAVGRSGRGVVNVQTVDLDGVEVPRAALEFFADRYLKPKYGDAVGVDSDFALPARIDTADVGANSVTVRQK